MALPREVNIRISDGCFDTPILLLGKVGENLATKVIIDASEWQDGTGTFQLLVKRADEEMFTATIEQADGVVTWLIPAAEIGVAGYGQVELNYSVGNACMKSATVDTRVFSSIEIDQIDTSGTTWSQLVLLAVGDAKSFAAGAKASADATRKIADQVETLLQSAVANATKSASDSAASALRSAQESASSATSASSSATDAANSASAAEQARTDVVNAHTEIFDVLNADIIRNTTVTATMNDDGVASEITHRDNRTGMVVRTDTFTYSGDIVIEVRTDADGRTQRNIYNLETLSAQFNV